MTKNINELIYNRKILYKDAEILELSLVPISDALLQIHKYIINDIKLLKLEIKYDKK